MTAKKPEIDFPGGEPPTDLVITDVVEGDGAEATSGDTVVVKPGNLTTGAAVEIAPAGAPAS